MDESFSGTHVFKLDKPFGDRNYFEVGIILKRHVVHVLQSMNSRPEYQFKTGDRTFLNTLLDRVFTKEELTESIASGNSSHAYEALCPRKLGFIQGNCRFQKFGLFKLFFFVVPICSS